MSSTSLFSTDTTSFGSLFGAQSLQMLGLPVKFVGFWTAVLLPFVLVGMLASGAVQQSPLLLSGLLTANVAGLVLGRDYKR